MSFRLNCIIRAGRRETSFSLVLTFAGRLVIFGWIDVSVLIVLTLRYTSAGGLVGEGYVRVRVKIAWKVYFTVSRSFTYQFRKEKGGGRAALGGGHPDTPRLAAGDERPQMPDFSRGSPGRVPEAAPFRGPARPAGRSRYV